MAFRQFQPNSLLVKEKKIEGKSEEKMHCIRKGAGQKA